jgi:hypothetical protein
LPVWHVDRGWQSGAQLLRELLDDRCAR